MRLRIALCLLWLAPLTIQAQHWQPPAHSQAVRVTHLGSDGPGSLRAALQAQGPRLVIFEVGGVIDLEGQPLDILTPEVWLAGESAPSPGITLIGGGINVKTHKVRISHLAVRPGDRGQPPLSGWTPDAISVSGTDAWDVLVSHCSVSWAVDENLSASGPRTRGQSSRDISFRDNLVAEALDWSSHPKGRHSKGALVHDFVQNVRFDRNVFAHNARRNPYFKAHSSGRVVNNLIYNPQSAAIQAGFIPEEWLGSGKLPANPQLTVVGNLLLHGRDSYSDLPLLGYQGDAYLADNLAFNIHNQPMSVYHGDIKLLAAPPVPLDDLTPWQATQLEQHLLAQVGARPAERDAVDARIIAAIRARTGRIIDSQSQVGGYPDWPASHRPLAEPAAGWLAWLEQEGRRLSQAAGGL